jgi:Ca2+-binding RTX toxin-like protein
MAKAYQGFATDSDDGVAGAGSEMAVARAVAMLEPAAAPVPPAAVAEPGVVRIEATGEPGIAAAINAALADPLVTKVILGAGVFNLEAPINVPSGKTLEGAGRNLTVLNVGADFARPGMGEEDGVVNSVRGSENVTVAGFTIDAGHMRPEGFRLHGCFMKDTTDFSVSEVDVYGSTGYAHFAAGTEGKPGFYTSGTYDDCQTFSSSIHFEQMFCDGVTLTNCHASDGDGVLRGIYFHPVLGSKNISYIDCSAYGTGVGVEMTADYIYPLENISFINCDVEISSDSMAFYAGGGNPHLNVQIINSRFVSHNQVAMILGGVTGTIVDSYIQGESTGLMIWAAGNGALSNIVGTNSTVLGIRNPSRDDGVSAIVSGSSAGTVHWIGGVVEARGKAWVTNLFIGDSGTHTADTKLVTSGFGTMLFYTENGEAAAFAPPLLLGGVGAGPAGFDGATLTVAYLANGTPADRLSVADQGEEPGQIALHGSEVSFGGVVVAVVSGGADGNRLVVTFNAAATAEAVLALSQAITYFNTSDTPDSLYRALSFRLVDADGAAAETSAALILTPVDDAAQVSAGTDTAAWTEGDSPVLLAPAATLSDIDGNMLAGGTLTLSFTSAADASDRLSILHSGPKAGEIGVYGDLLAYSGQLLGTVSGGTGSTPLVIAFAQNAPIEAVQALLRALVYSNGGDAPSEGLRTIGFELTASSGATSAGSFTVAVTPVDDPLLPLDDEAVTNDDAAVIIDAAANDDPDGPRLAIVSVAGAALAPGESVTLASGATVTLNSDGTLTYDPGSAFLSLTAPGSGASNTTAFDSFDYLDEAGAGATVRVTIRGVTAAGDALLGSVENDVLTGSAGAETFRLEQGGEDGVAAGAGADMVFFGATLGDGDRIDGGEGADTLALQGDYVLSLGADSLKDVETITLLSGSEVRFGSAGTGLHTYVLATHDANVASGAALLVRFADLQAGETVSFDGSAETDGRFVFEGGGGDDVLKGGAGNDIFDAGAGADNMAGGGGDDLYFVDSAADQVIELEAGGTDEVRTALGSRTDFTAMYILPDHVEQLTGTSAIGQGVYGNALDNIIVMGGGGDLIVLSDGGNDYVDGGGGDDFLFYGDALTAEDISIGGAGFDGIGLLGSYDLKFTATSLQGIEKLAVYSAGSHDGAVPNSYSLTMVDANVARGRQLLVTGQSLQAAESLNFDGSAERDGSFNIRGGRGDDILKGGSRADQLYGNLGADVLVGGAGADQFEYYDARESTAVAMDRILDFGAGDKLNLVGIDANGDPADGNGGFRFIGKGAFSGATGELRITGSQGLWLVEADIDGDKVADLVISVATVGGHVLSAADIWF